MKKLCYMCGRRVWWWQQWYYTYDAWVYHWRCARAGKGTK